MNNGRLTHLKDKRKETKELDWASVSPTARQWSMPRISTSTE